MEKEVVIKLLFGPEEHITIEDYAAMIDALNNKLFPVNEITMNGDLIFSDSQGFIKKDKEK